TYRDLEAGNRPHHAIATATHRLYLMRRRHAGTRHACPARRRLRSIRPQWHRSLSQHGACRNTCGLGARVAVSQDVEAAFRPALLTASLETRRYTSLGLCASCGDTLRARHRHDGFEFALGSQPMFDVVAVREPFL